MAVNAMAGTEPVNSCTARPPCRVGEMPRREAMACRLKPVSGRDCIPWHTSRPVLLRALCCLAAAGCDVL